jgi:hypothetical protein
MMDLMLEWRNALRLLAPYDLAYDAMVAH